MTTAFAYDTVDYPSAALPQAHPSHLFAVARAFGLDPPAAEACRYLEFGCGDGTHLIACAVGLPGATFVGVDLSAAAVERGNRVIVELGLPNVSLYAADLTRWEPPADAFDYAAAHGLYSWVPAPVRDALLGLYARVLKPNGVGYVSYNIFPGCHIRRMLWEMLRHHTADVADPGAKIGEARELIQFLAAGQPRDGGPLPAMYAGELDRLLKDDPSVLYHDDMSAVNDPVYFHQFAAHAQRFGLRFVADAEPNSMDPRAFPTAVAASLTAMADRDVLRKEQYLDFLRLRRFRQTILSPDGSTPRVRPDPTVVPGLFVSGRPKPAAEPVDLRDGVPATFTGARSASATLAQALPKAALVELADRWPGRLRSAELLRLAAARAGREPGDGEAEALDRLLADLWMAGLVTLHGHNPRYAATPSDRPVASPLARLQLRTGPQVTTLLHRTMRLEDAPARHLVQLLDGTRDRAQLAAEAGVEPAELDLALERFAKAGLLVG